MECKFKKYLERWNRKYPERERECVYYTLLSEEEKKMCEKCEYRPKGKFVRI